MSKVIEVKDPQGCKIYYRDEDHKYYDEDGGVYQSVTTIIHSLFPEFEKDKMSYFVARKRVMKDKGYPDKDSVPNDEIEEEKKVVLKEWEDNKNVSCDLGTEVHRYCECKLAGVDFDMELTSDRAKKIAKSADEFLLELDKSYEFLEAEKIIFRKPYLLAGTVDLIMRNRNTGNLCVFDHKTNKAINKTDSYGKTGKLFLSHIENCNYMVYTLQLSLYKHMLIDGNYGDFDNAELGLFHYTTRGVRCYQLNDLNLEAKYIADYCKKLKGKK